MDKLNKQCRTRKSYFRCNSWNRPRLGLTLLTSSTIANVMLLLKMQLINKLILRRLTYILDASMSATSSTLPRQQNISKRSQCRISQTDGWRSGMYGSFHWPRPAQEVIWLTGKANNHISFCAASCLGVWKCRHINRPVCKTLGRILKILCHEL